MTEGVFFFLIFIFWFKLLRCPYNIRKGFEHIFPFLSDISGIFVSNMNEVCIIMKLNKLYYLYVIVIRQWIIHKPQDYLKKSIILEFFIAFTEIWLRAGHKMLNISISDICITNIYIKKLIVEKKLSVLCFYGVASFSIYMLRNVFPLNLSWPKIVCICVLQKQISIAKR